MPTVRDPDIAPGLAIDTLAHGTLNSTIMIRATASASDSTSSNFELPTKSSRLFRIQNAGWARAVAANLKP